LGCTQEEAAKRQVALCCRPGVMVLKSHVALGLPAASTQCYFRSSLARPKASHGPCLAVPKPKRHLTLGLQRRGSRPCATWHLGCPPSGGEPKRHVSQRGFFFTIIIFFKKFINDNNNNYTLINFNENNNIYNTNNNIFSSNNMNYYKNNIIYNTKYNNILETNTINYTKK
jgi:hypothetical protein